MPVSVESAGERRLALSVAPNPATVTSWIRFTLPVPGRARLRVHDVAGRLVRELASEHLPAGAHEFRWDGTAANGRPVSAGVYLVRLESESGTVLRKLARTR
jgi:hypothetical protein